MNRFIRRGRYTFAIVIALPIAAIFLLAKPSYIAAQPLPLLEKVGERYVIVARRVSGLDCYGSDLGDNPVLPPYDALWAQVIRVSDLTAPGPNEISCADCHCDSCGATTKHLTDPSRSETANLLTLHDFLTQGQYAPLLITQRPVLCADCHDTTARGKPGTENVKSIFKN